MPSSSRKYYKNVEFAVSDLKTKFEIVRRYKKGVRNCQALVTEFIVAIYST